MEYLYVCLFSNGVIKVGRSINPASRIASHADRVACMGVELKQWDCFKCESYSVEAERALINMCTAAAQQRFQNEWFVGLLYGDVAIWASQCADAQYHQSGSKWASLIVGLMAGGMTQAEIAAHCSCSQPSISELKRGITAEPSYSIGSALIQLSERKAS